MNINRPRLYNYTIVINRPRLYNYTIVQEAFNNTTVCAIVNSAARKYRLAINLH